MVGRRRKHVDVPLHYALCEASKGARRLELGAGPGALDQKTMHCGLSEICRGTQWPIIRYWVIRYMYFWWKKYLPI